MKTMHVLTAMALLLAVGFSSCKNGQQSLLPPCTGKPGEVLVVIAEDLYKGAIGDSIRLLLLQEEPALPQTGMEGAEAMFSLIQLPPEALNNTIRPARNLIIIDVDATATKSEIRFNRDYWADEQILIRLVAPDRDQLLNLFNENRMNILEVLREGEVDRQVAYNRKYVNADIAQKLLDNHEIGISFPKGFQIRVDTGNFAWMQYDPADATQGVLIWSYPYQSENQLELENLQAFTNDILEPRVPGPSGPGKGSFMRIVPDIPVQTRTFTLNGTFVKEMRGLWEVKVDFMGGPFISWTFVDEKRNRLVTTFGFVYAPKVDKRNQVRKVEGILKTVTFPDQVR